MIRTSPRRTGAQIKTEFFLPTKGRVGWYPGRAAQSGAADAAFHTCDQDKRNCSSHPKSPWRFMFAMRPKPDDWRQIRDAWGSVSRPTNGGMA
jgi:hypothetical protein